jgi:hypothetical protein
VLLWPHLDGIDIVNFVGVYALNPNVLLTSKFIMNKVVIP